MGKKSAFLLGGIGGFAVAVGLGKDRLEHLAERAQELWDDPRLQDTIADLEKKVTGLAGDGGPRA